MNQKNANAASTVMVWDPNPFNPYAAEVSRVISSSTHRTIRFGRSGGQTTGFNVVDLNVIPEPGLASGSLLGKVKYLKAISQFAAKAAANRSIVVVPWVTTNVEALILLCLTYVNKRVILVIHNPVDGRYDEMAKLSRRRLHARAGLVVVHDSRLIPLLGAASRTAVVGHPTYLSWWRANKPKTVEAPPGKGKVALFLGSLRPDKGTADLPELARELAIRGVVLRVACGKTPAQVCEAMKMVDNLQLLAGGDTYLSDQAIAECLSQADVLVVPYTNVTTSGSVLLAATAGKRIVGYRSPMLSRVVREDRCVDGGDVAALADMVELAINDSPEEQTETLRAIEREATSTWSAALRLV